MFTGYSVKTEKYNYVEWTRLATNEVLAAELYDNVIDPQETANVVDSPEYEKNVLQMIKFLKAGWQKAVPSGR